MQQYVMALCLVKQMTKRSPYLKEATLQYIAKDC